MARLDLTQTAEVKKLLKDKPPLPATQDGLAALQQVVDRAVRGSRDQYWCERLEAMLEATVPQMAAADGHFYASDDLDCRKAKMGAGQAYNERGYNADGIDRDGIDRYGRPSTGYFPDGFSREFDRDGYDRYGYNHDGFGRDGLRRVGRGPTPEEEEAGKGMLNPTTAVLGPDGKLYRKGTKFDTIDNGGPVVVVAPVKRAARKVTVAKATAKLAEAALI